MYRKLFLVWEQYENVYIKKKKIISIEINKRFPTYLAWGPHHPYSQATTGYNHMRNVKGMCVTVYMR